MLATLSRRCAVSSNTFDPDQPTWKRGLTRAIDGVNGLLRALDVSFEMDQRLQRQSAALPFAFKLQEIDDGRQIRFLAIQRSYPEHPDEASATITKQRRRVARPRPLTRRSEPSEEDIKINKIGRYHEERATQDRERRALWDAADNGDLMAKARLGLLSEE